MQAHPEAAATAASTSAPTPIVRVVDDDPGVHDTVQALAASVGHRVASYRHPEEFLRRCEGSRPGCIVLDLRMPAMSGLEVLARLQQKDIRLPVVFLSAYADVSVAVQAMKRGAVDFLEKPFHPQTLLDALHRAIEHDARRRRRETAAQAVRRLYDGLSERERQVMAGVVAGKSNKAVARELGLSPKTVEVHRANVMRKMRAASLAELVQMSAISGG